MFKSTFLIFFLIIFFVSSTDIANGYRLSRMFPNYAMENEIKASSLYKLPYFRLMRTFYHYRNDNDDDDKTGNSQESEEQIKTTTTEAPKKYRHRFFGK